MIALCITKCLYNQVLNWTQNVCCLSQSRLCVLLVQMNTKSTRVCPKGCYPSPNSAPILIPLLQQTGEPERSSCTLHSSTINQALFQV